MHPTLARPVIRAGLYLLCAGAWLLAWGTGPLGTFGLILLTTLLIFFLERRHRLGRERLRQGLRRTNLQLEQAQRDAILGNWEYDRGFSWSPGAQRILGCAGEDNVDGLLNRVHPADRSGVQRALESLILHGIALTVNARLNLPSDQPPIWLALRGEAQPDGRAFGTVQDISTQKRDEEALRASELRFRQLFEQTPRIAVQGYDRQRRVIYWNRASEQLYGYTMDQAMGRYLEELIIPPAMRDQVIADINNWLIGGTAIPASELTLQRRDGSPVTVFSSHLLLRNLHNQLELYCVDIDFSALKSARDALRQSEKRYQALLESIGRRAPEGQSSGGEQG
ncbi:PAS domain S-box protein [Pseudomonas sp. BN515]|uniref:PAS domain-containing protein n=1 Tax=Pseudomonas sp. BN515 TaxID=2567892 RepID=UPI002458FDB4|nr:PAS domain S-box protein [Pseudomonas sp. BN515]MDH4871327.1 PAS domain S-box protein [Pseudomonas sp. BN515]